MEFNPADVEAIFSEAIDKPASERSAFLDKACNGNAALRARVDELLKSHFSAATFLEPPPGAGLAGTLQFPQIAQEQTGSVIGRYKLLQLIGEGGFGTVYMAEQEHPVRRRVALKIIKPGMDTRQVIARFEAERQALAMMDHPCIARVFDAGATDSGRPYFVMELVRGVPITEYCDQHHLDLTKRLELFVQVCNAVQHAHQKGLIHRDIKPTNVLVSTIDDRPAVKVIDFGIAKATEARLTEKTLFTEFRQFIGTPEYISPEQAEGTLDIDTRADVYGLGVLLYELLAGATPFDSRDLRSKAYAEMQRIICEVDPPRPSTRLSTLDTLASVAARRSTEPRKLGAAVRGELDWIVMKCLEKDRKRRYDSASALATDITRYLADEPVSAGPPSNAYRVRKFIRRHRGPVLAGLLVLCVLLAGIAGTTIGLIGQARQRRIAEQKTIEAQQHEQEAKTQAAIAAAVSQFQTDMLASADPEQARGDKVTVLEMTEAGVKQLDAGTLKDQPLVEASVRETIARTYYSLARLAEAEASLRKALELRRKALPPGHEDIAATMSYLSQILVEENNVDEADQLARESLAMMRANPPADRMKLSAALDSVGLIAQSRGQYAEAEKNFRESLDITRATRQYDFQVAACEENLALMLSEQGKFAEAETLFREALALTRRSQPPGHASIGKALNALALLLQQQGKYAQSEPLVRESLEIARKTVPAGHPSIAARVNNLGIALQEQGKFKEAEACYEESLAMLRAMGPAGEPSLVKVLGHLGMCLEDEGKLPEAERYMREMLTVSRRSLPPGHPDIGSALNVLGSLLENEGKLAESEAMLRESLQIHQQALPPGHQKVGQVINNLGMVLLKEKKLPEAEQCFRDALAIYRKALPSGHAQTGSALNNLGSTLYAEQRYADAEPALVEAVQIIRNSPGHPYTLDILFNLAKTYLARSKFVDAEPLFRETISMLDQKGDGKSWRAAQAHTRLGRALTGQNRYRDAEAELTTAEQIVSADPQSPAGVRTECISNLAALYDAWDKSDPGQGHNAKAREWREKLPATQPATQPATTPSVP